MRIKRVYIFLTGGLGNQLFQIAAAKSLNPEEIKVITSVGHPRINSSGRADVLSLNIGEEVSEHKVKHENRFVSKIFGYLMRSSINPTRLELIYLRRLMRCIAAVILKYEINDKFKIHHAEDIGFTDLDVDTDKILLIGYFQSHKYLEKIRQGGLERKKSIFNQNMSEDIEAPSFNQSKLIVHFRLGDYKFDKSFGVINPSYYLRAISKILNKHSFDEILIFSDEINLARKLLSINFIGKITWVDSQEYDTISSFQLMRQGHAFIIGNSTFSWWAASLSLNKPWTVIAPDPWFAGLPEPRHLIPNDWDRIKADFILSKLD